MSLEVSWRGDQRKKGWHDWKVYYSNTFRLVNQLLQLASVSISTDTDFEKSPTHSSYVCSAFLLSSFLSDFYYHPHHLPHLSFCLWGSLYPAFLSTQLPARDAIQTYWAVNSAAQGVDSFLLPLSHTLTCPLLCTNIPPPPQTCAFSCKHTVIISVPGDTCWAPSLFLGPQCCCLLYWPGGNWHRWSSRICRW